MEDQVGLVVHYMKDLMEGNTFLKFQELLEEQRQQQQNECHEEDSHHSQVLGDFHLELPLDRDV